MGDPKGFLKVKRATTQYRPVCERIKDYSHVFILRSKRGSKEQASRCMDCGTPFCHWGCAVGNYIPEWNDLMFNGRWRKAFELLDATNNLPEITGRVCPAPCEYACILGINDDPVTIRENELAIIEYAFKEGLIKPNPPRRRTAKKIAIIGSGPTGLSCAAQLNKAGHKVTVFERDDKVGGILRYGIPDFKLEKWVIDRRIKIWQKEGIEFITNINVGQDYSTSKLIKTFDALCLAGGSRVPKDLNIEGRNLKGIFFAMDYLTQANRRIAEENISWGIGKYKIAAHQVRAWRRKLSNSDFPSSPKELAESSDCRPVSENELINAKGKKVIVIGGGDTGADCVGTAHRQGATCVTQIELLPQPPDCRSEEYPWPAYPMILKTSSSHEEGGTRQWSVLTKKFIGKNGCVHKISCVKVEFLKQANNACPVMKEIPDSEFEIEADMIILAMGFLSCEHSTLLTELGVKFDSRGNLKTDENYMTNVKGIFSAGDMRRGQSLIVWAISEGRHAAYSIDKYLMGRTYLPNM